MTAQALVTTPDAWPQPDGTPVSCREKLRMLEDNHAELQGMLRDVFEDAVLMGVDQAAMRGILVAMVERLRMPKSAGTPGSGPA